MSQLISFLFHALFFFTPLLLWPQASEVFEFPKMLFVYCITILITTAQIIDWVRKKKITIRRTPLDLPILLFLGVQILSTIFSIDPHTSIWGYYSRFHGGLASTVSYILLFYIFISTSPKRDRKSKGEHVLSYINTILLSTGLISVYAVLEHFGIDKNLWVQDVQSRVFSTLGQPNWLSAYLVAILPLPILIFLKEKKLTHLLLSFIIITSIIFTKSQSGLATLLIVLVTIALYKARTKLKIVLPVFLILSITLLLLKPQSLGSLNKINPFYSTTQEIAKEDLNTRGNGGSDSMTIRRVVWQGAINLGKKHPILGTGPETFAYSYYWERPVEHNLLSEWEFLYNKAHNEYLNFFATTGILGLGTYLFFIIATIKWWLKNKSSSISTALFIGWLSILITNFFGFSVVAVALLFFLFPALNILLTEDHPKTKQLKLSVTPSFLNIITIILSIYLLTSLINTFRADLKYNSSNFHINAGQNQNALELLKTAVDLKPRQPLFLAKLAEQEAKVAASIFLQLDKLPPEAKTLTQQYQASALKHADKAVDLNPYNLNFLKSKARVEIYLSNIDPNYQQSALNTLLQASILAPTDPKLLYNVAILYQNLGQRDLAIRSYKRAVELKPNYQEAIERINKLQP